MAFCVYELANSQRSYTNPAFCASPSIIDILAWIRYLAIDIATAYLLLKPDGQWYAVVIDPVTNTLLLFILLLASQ